MWNLTYGAIALPVLVNAATIAGAPGSPNPELFSRSTTALPEKHQSPYLSGVNAS